MISKLSPLTLFLFLQSEGEEFVIFLKDEGSPDYKMKWSGEVYPIIKYGDGEFSFYNEHKSDPEDDKEKARCFFHFSYCWRGVWEGRVYPKQQEYWGEDISLLSDLWDRIEYLLKERIKKDNPDYECFD